MTLFKTGRALCATSLAAHLALASPASACTALMITDANGVAYSGKTMEFSEPLPLAMTYLPAGTAMISLAADGTAPLMFRKWLVIDDEVLIYEVRDDSNYPSTGVAVPLSNALAGVPDAGDVRSGTAFGAGDSLTGTLAVPAAGSVALGVPVDDTTGTAVLTPAAVWGHEVDTGVTAEERLLAQARIASTGAQVAAAVTA